jgi:hypothetical protein
VTQRLEAGDGGTGFDFLRIVDLSPGELEATVFNLYQQWLLLARRTAQNLLQVTADMLVSVSRAVSRSGFIRILIRIWIQIGSRVLMTKK